MSRGKLTAIILAAATATSAHANLFDEARAEASARAQYNGNGAQLLQVRSHMSDEDALRQNATFAYADTSAWNGATTQSGYQLPTEVQPWGWSWFPFYQCSLVYWRPTAVQLQGGQVSMSPLEKLDTLAYNNGNEQPFAAGFEACDARPWVSQSRGLPSGHNLTRAVMEAGNKTTIPWQSNGQAQQIDVSWWGHCNGWAAAAVSFPESKLSPRWVNLARGGVRFLNRPEFDQMGGGEAGRGGGLIGLYQQAPAQQMYVFTEDLKSMLTEYGMQLRPNPAFSSGRRYEAPSADIEEYFFERRADGTVVIPQDATFVWVVMMIDGQQAGGWQIPRGYPDAQLAQWRYQMEQYYRQYYPGRQVYTMCMARYTNLPMHPTEDQLRDLPQMVRKSFLDVDPLEFHNKATAAFSGSGGTKHSLIAEVSAGVQVWNFPMKAYGYSFTGINEIAYNQNATFTRGASSDPSSLFNLSSLDRNKLPVRNGQRVLRYRVGSMRVTLQKVTEPYDENYRFLVFYGEGDNSIGSTWAAESLTQHPDFVWYPDLDNPGVPSAGNPYVRAADLKAMLPDLPIR